MKGCCGGKGDRRLPQPAAIGANVGGDASMTPQETDEVTKVYSTADALSAHALAAHLVDEGIDAHVVGDFLSGAYGGVDGPMTRVEVWAPAAQRDQAASLIARWLPEDVSCTPDASAGFRYSLMTALAGTTLVAVFLGARPVPEENAAATMAAIAMNIALWGAFIYFALLRRRLARNPPPSLPATPLD